MNKFDFRMLRFRVALASTPVSPGLFFNSMFPNAKLTVYFFDLLIVFLITFLTFSVLKLSRKFIF